MGFKRNRVVEREDSNDTTPEEKIIEVVEQTKTTEVIEETKTTEVIEEKKEVQKNEAPEASELTDRKLNCGITGDTLEVKEFRAIVKKQGKQINVVITDILSDWNQKNYNL